MLAEEVEEPLLHVQGGQAEDPFREIPLFAQKHGDEVPSEGLLLEQAVELFPGKEKDLGRRQSAGADREPVLLEQHHLPEDLPRPKQLDDHFLAVLRALEELNGALRKDVHGVTLLPFQEEGLPFAEHLRNTDGGDGPTAGGGESPKEVRFFQQLVDVHGGSRAHYSGKHRA